MNCERTARSQIIAPDLPPRDMNTRLIISLLFAGALAFACGPRSRSESAAVASLQPLQLTNKIDVPLEQRRRSLETSARREGRSRKIDSQLQRRRRIERDSVRAQRRRTSARSTSSSRFPSGKSYDFVVVDSIGREVWHWSNGRMFTQGVQNKQLGTGDAMHVAEAWKRPLQPGRYTAIATLNSSNYPRRAARRLRRPVRKL